MKSLLDIKDLRVELVLNGLKRSIIRGIDLNVKEGEIVGLVGESGCGKTITAGALIGLLPAPGNIDFSSYELSGEKIVNEERALGRLRGPGIAMIFQEPTSHLDPLWRVEDQLVETLKTHRKSFEGSFAEEARRLLDSVGLEPAAIFGRRYPHELSGGMNQRVMIALALACSPKLLIADEPTTALDDHHQRVVTDLICRHFKNSEHGVLWISHDISLLRLVADRILVMQQGLIIEEGTVEDILRAPRQPLTRALIDAMPERLCSSKPEN